LVLAKRPSLVLGFLPVGLAYHAAYTIAIALLMTLLVKTAGRHISKTRANGRLSGKR
jgi:hypothetical protein